MTSTRARLPRSGARHHRSHRDGSDAAGAPITRPRNRRCVNDPSLKYDADLDVFVPARVHGKAPASHPQVEMSTPLL